jgi:hypothetical protein
VVAAAVLVGGGRYLETELSSYYPVYFFLPHVAAHGRPFPDTALIPPSSILSGLRANKN